MIETNLPVKPNITSETRVFEPSPFKGTVALERYPNLDDTRPLDRESEALYQSWISRRRNPVLPASIKPDGRTVARRLIMAGMFLFS